MKKNEHSTQSLTNLSKTSGLSLDEYKEEIGKEEYWKQYRRIYAYSKYLDDYNVRYSGSDTKPDLDKIKEKYKNGVTNDIMREWFL